MKVEPRLLRLMVMDDEGTVVDCYQFNGGDAFVSANAHGGVSLSNDVRAAVCEMLYEMDGRVAKSQGVDLVAARVSPRVVDKLSRQKSSQMDRERFTVVK